MINKNPNRFYVYVYLDPRKPGKYKYGEYEFDYEPVYVGKGTNYRLNSHLYEAFSNKNIWKNERKCKRICEIIKDNLIFLTYEYKIVLALAGYNYFDKIFGEISYYFSGDTISIAVKWPLLSS